MPSYFEIFPDRWLTAEKLQGKNVTITIKEVHLEEVFNPLTKQKERRLAATFPNREIMLTINKTNAHALAEITQTDQYDQWRNVRVTLVPGRAPNGKATILIKPAPPAQAPVHGRVDEGQVHGRAEESQMHGQPVATPVHGRATSETARSTARPDEMLDARPDEVPWSDDTDDTDDDFVPGDEDDDDEVVQEDTSAAADPKSGEPDPPTRPTHGDGEAIFLTPADIVAKVKSLHQQSTEPMTAKQADYISRSLLRFSGKNAEIVWAALMERTVSEDNPPGALVGRYLYDLLREDQQPYPAETAALRNLCERLP